MTGPSMGVVELARELGRTDNWLLNHWRELVMEKKMPAPINGGRQGTGTLVWSRAQIYAWLDRDLTPQMQIAAAAYRAAAAAAAGVYHTGGEERAIAEHHDRLMKKYGRAS